NHDLTLVALHLGPRRVLPSWTAACRGGCGICPIRRIRARCVAATRILDRSVGAARLDQEVAEGPRLGARIVAAGPGVPAGGAGEGCEHARGRVDTGQR